MGYSDFGNPRTTSASYEIDDKIGRKIGVGKFYSTARMGSEGYNPEIKVYYGSDDNIVRIEEIWRGEVWAQTISGSNYAQQWPNYSYTETFNPWEKTTVSG